MKKSLSCGRSHEVQVNRLEVSLFLPSIIPLKGVLTLLFKSVASEIDELSNPNLDFSNRGRYFAVKSTKVKNQPRAGKSPVSFLSTPKNNPNRKASAVKLRPPQPSPAEARKIFLENLRLLEGVSFVNTIDNLSPPIDFQFIKEVVIGRGVVKATDEFMFGCTCRKDNGRNIGCEYLTCECLEDSARNAHGRKVFPYAAGHDTSQCLREFYLTGGYHIFECNERCNCPSNCKNRVVQQGRTVPLEIFKTTNRGWGVYC